MPLDAAPDLTSMLVSEHKRILLPPSATPRMRALSETGKFSEDLWSASQRVGNIRGEVPDSALPFLIYEHGLEQVAAWIIDPRYSGTLLTASQRLRLAFDQGRYWQKIRGTPSAIALALSWVGAPLDLVEEEANGTWWDLFQLGFSRAISVRDERYRAIIELTRLSAAAHTDVIRVYNKCWDIRPHIWDEHKFDGGGLWDDWSGVWSSPGMPKVSFCVTSKDVADLSEEVGAVGWALRSTSLDVCRTSSPLLADFTSVVSTRLQHASIVSFEFEGGYEDGSWVDQPYGFQWPQFAEALSREIAEPEVALLEFSSAGVTTRSSAIESLFDDGYPDEPYPDAPWGDGIVGIAGSAARTSSSSLDVYADVSGYGDEPYSDGPYDSADFAYGNATLARRWTFDMTLTVSFDATRYVSFDQS